MTVCAHAVPDLEKKGSITVTMRQGEKTVPGGTLTLYRVGVVSENDGNYDFVLTDEFAGSGLTLEDIHSAQLAGELADYAKAHGMSGTTQNIGTDGTVTFRDLEPGLYLLVQNKAAAGYYAATPFLVSVPMLEGGLYVYEVDASPKVEIKKMPETPETPEEPETPDEPETPEEPETSDEPETPTESEAPEIPDASITPGTPEAAAMTLPQTGQMNWPVPVLAAAGLGLFLAGWIMRYGKKKSDHEK